MPKWRNWQTHWTQNPAGLAPRGGSTPPFGKHVRAVEDPWKRAEPFKGVPRQRDVTWMPALGLADGQLLPAKINVLPPQPQPLRLPDVCLTEQSDVRAHGVVNLRNCITRLSIRFLRLYALAGEMKG